MKKIISVSIFLVFHLVGLGQELSLDQALTLAKKTKVDQATYQAAVQSLNVKIQQGKKRPTAFGEANVQRNLITPVTPVPAVAFDMNAPAGDIIPLRFATDWSMKGGIQLSYDVFNPQLKSNIRNAQLQEEKSKIDINAAEQDVKKTVTELYAQAYLAQEQLRISNQIMNLYDSTQQVIELRYAAGRATSIERNNALKKSLELQQLYEEASLVYRNAWIALLPYIDVKGFDTLTTSIQDIITMRPMRNYELDRLTMDAQIKDAALAGIRREALPTVTLNGYIGAQHYSNDFDIFNHQNWFGNSYINVGLRVPILEGYERNLRTLQTQQELMLARAKYDEAMANQQVTQMQIQNEIAILEGKIYMLERQIAIVADNITLYRAQLAEGTVLINDVNKELEMWLEQYKKLWQTYYDVLMKKLELVAE